MVTHPAEIRSCPRCGYRGEGIPYFERGVNLTVLIVLVVVTSWAFGAAGILFYLLRRKHESCPRCGRSWGRYASDARLESRSSKALPDAGSREAPPPPTSSRGGWTVLLFVIGAVFLAAGVVAEDPAALVAGALAVAGGVMSARRARRRSARRRRSLLERQQTEVLRLARDRRGSLTVSETAALLGWTLGRAERVLISLEDGFRVRSDVTADGRILYEFPELASSDPPLPQGDGSTV